MADREKQLGNVAFGGNWSEELLVLDKLNQLLEVIERAANECAERDVRDDELSQALEDVRTNIEKGPMLVASFEKSLASADPQHRRKETMRVARLIRLWAGL